MQNHTIAKTTLQATGEIQMKMQKTQHGASAIKFIIILALFGYGVFVGLQYIPQRIESGIAQAVLDNLVEIHRKEPFSDVRDIKTAIEKQLFINERDDLKSSFEVTRDRGDYVVTVRYDRELNLLFKKQPMPTDKSVTLN